ncbi:MAG: phosphatidylserine decarboxylase family protein [Chitinophagales bacterium]
MRIHREGTVTIIGVFILLVLLNYGIDRFVVHIQIIQFLLAVASLAFFLFIISFFRNPLRKTIINAGEVIAPADGKVVVIEQTEETEYFHSKRIQVSIFMSPANVHVNRTPINGEVKYVQYHPGKHFIASLPKSSTDNEHNTIVIRDGQHEILLRQIAGILARRIVSYLKTGQQVNAGDHLGFIKFGSRVDVFFPPDAEILVKLNDYVRGGETVMGKFSV